MLFGSRRGRGCGHCGLGTSEGCRECFGFLLFVERDQAVRRLYRSAGNGQKGIGNRFSGFERIVGHCRGIQRFLHRGSEFFRRSTLQSLQFAGYSCGRIFAGAFIGSFSAPDRYIRSRDLRVGFRGGPLNCRSSGRGGVPRRKEAWFVSAVKKPAQRIVFFLCNWIVFVIMTAGATRG